MGESCAAGIDFKGKQVKWPEIVEKKFESKEQGILIDVRPKVQHDLINFTSNLEMCYSMPLKELKKLGKEDIQEKFGVEENSKSSFFFLLWFISFCIM